MAELGALLVLCRPRRRGKGGLVSSALVEGNFGETEVRCAGFLFFLVFAKLRLIEILIFGS